MALHYGVFEENEEARAFEQLLKMVHDADDHIDLGVLGCRVIFHVLTKFGQAELAYHMITREDYPSYGNWLKRGATTLWENFAPNGVSSMNHHFWGDISAWFIKSIAGIRVNPTERDVNELEICPHFINALDCASAYHIAPAGKITASWERKGDSVLLSIEIPSAVRATACLSDGYTFENGSASMPVNTGVYKIIKA